MDSNKKKCKYCKTEMDKNTKICPNCKKSQSISPIVVFILIVIVFCIVCAILVGTSGESDSSDSYISPSKDNSSTETSSSEESKKEVELSESDKMILKISDLFDEKLAFDTGNYIKGDIPAGEYAFVKFDGSGSYYEEDDAAGNIIDNENFSSFGYVKVHATGNLETDGVLINVKAIDKLGVKSAKEVYEILNNQSNYNQAGYYKVGVDIEPGTYKLESFGSGYWAIMTGPVGSSEIVNNDNFNGRASVNLKKGQYLDLSSASFTKK